MNANKLFLKAVFAILFNLSVASLSFATVLFQDNFDSGTASPLWVSKHCCQSVQNGWLHSQDIDGWPRDAMTVVHDADPQWKDYKVSLTAQFVQSTPWNTFTILLRNNHYDRSSASGGGAAYQLTFNGKGLGDWPINQIILERIDCTQLPCLIKELIRQNVTLPLDPMSLEITVEGGRIHLTINQLQIFDVTDPSPLAYGGVGLHTIWESETQFDNIVVSTLGDPYDITTQSTFNLDFAKNYDAKNVKTVELKNTSANPIKVSNVIISNAASYWVNLFADSKSTCRAKYYLPFRKDFTIPANSSCNIGIGFSPFNNLTAGKPIAATMTLKTTINGVATDKVINLTGLGRKQVPSFYNRDPKLRGLDTWAVSELKGGNIPINTSLVGVASGYDSAKYWYGSLIDPTLKKAIASVGNLVVFAENSENPSGHVSVVIQKTPVLTMLTMSDIRDSKGVKLRRWSVRPVNWYGSKAIWSPLITGFNATNAVKHYGFIDWRSDLY